MDFVLLALGAICLIFGLPLCFSCRVRAFWDKMSKGKASQANQQVNRHAKLYRAIGSILTVIGVILIAISFGDVDPVY
jgi:uncharacterized membrane protein YccF (DUF307 family)